MVVKQNNIILLSMSFKKHLHVNQTGHSLVTKVKVAIAAVFTMVYAIALSFLFFLVPKDIVFPASWPQNDFGLIIYT